MASVGYKINDSLLNGFDAFQVTCFDFQIFFCTFCKNLYILALNFKTFETLKNFVNFFVNIKKKILFYKFI